MSKIKGGLGKGLSALLPDAGQPAQHAVPPPVHVEPQPLRPTPEDAAPSGHGEQPLGTQSETSVPEAHMMEIEVVRIRPNPFQPRADFDPVALDELKQSIRKKGIIQPVTVRRRADGEYELISGERRVRAATEVGLWTIPAYIRDVTSDQEMLELALVENLQREHLNPIEIAISYQRLSEDIGLAPEEIAKRVGKDRSTVVNFLRLLKLPEKIQQAVRKNSLSTGHARALLGAQGEALQLQLFEQVVAKELSVRQVEQLVKAAGKIVAKKKPAAAIPSDSAIATIEEKIRRLLATKVKVTLKDDGKGEIVIEFYNPDDLGRIFELIASIRT
jgi:ParB family chromosome partitioning protein